MRENDRERLWEELVRVRKRGKVRASVCERETETEKGWERKRMYKIKNSVFKTDADTKHFNLGFRKSFALSSPPIKHCQGSRKWKRGHFQRRKWSNAFEVEGRQRFWIFENYKWGDLKKISTAVLFSKSRSEKLQVEPKEGIWHFRLDEKSLIRKLCLWQQRQVKLPPSPSSPSLSKSRRKRDREKAKQSKAFIVLWRNSFLFRLFGTNERLRRLVGWLDVAHSAQFIHFLSQSDRLDLNFVEFHDAFTSSRYGARPSSSSAAAVSFFVSFRGCGSCSEHKQPRCPQRLSLSSHSPSLSLSLPPFLSLAVLSLTFSVLAALQRTAPVGFCCSRFPLCAAAFERFENWKTEKEINFPFISLSLKLTVL